MAAPRLDVSKISKLKPEVLFEFDDWSFEGSSRGPYDGLFGENIHLFLQECGLHKNVIVSEMPLWNIKVGGQNGIDLPLNIIEESAKRPHNPFCDHCKLAGWGDHFVSKKKYHLIVPECDKWASRLEKDGFDRRTHLLYGLIHCNGYGHLICINGVNENSDFPSKNDTMNLWDRICSMLRTREISVCDEMDVKLLHVLAFGKSWYGKWGYEFKGTNYKIAAKFLRSFGLDQIAIDLKDTESKTKFGQIVDKYKKVRNIPIANIGNLLHFMLAFEARAKMDKDSLVTSLAKSCSRPKSDINRELTGIWNLLRQNKDKTAENGRKGVVSVEQLKDDAEIYSEDCELTQFVLKSIRFLKMDGHVIRGSTNWSTNQMELEIHEVLQNELDVFPYYGSKYDCRWPEKGIRHAAGEIIKIADDLNKGNIKTLSRQELEREAMKIIDDTALISFVLNSINRTMSGNQMLSGTYNPNNGRDIYTAQDIVKLDRIDHIIQAGENVDEDVLHLYRTLLSGFDDKHIVPLGIQVLMESKICVKEWPLKKQDSEQSIAFSFEVHPSKQELVKKLARPLSPGVVLQIPPRITKASLKEKVQSALRDTYFVTEKFELMEIVGLEHIRNGALLSHSMLPGYNRDASVKGKGLDFQTEMIYEDGERLIECNRCHEVRITSCRHYNALKDIFLCEKCEVSREA